MQYVKFITQEKKLLRLGVTDCKKWCWYDSTSEYITAGQAFDRLFNHFKSMTDNGFTCTSYRYIIKTINYRKNGVYSFVFQSQSDYIRGYFNLEFSERFDCQHFGVPYSSCSNCGESFYTFLVKNNKCLRCCCREYLREKTPVDFESYLVNHCVRNKVNKRINNSKKLRLGFELEISRGNSFITDKQARELVSDLTRKGFVCKRDGSCYGEFVSSPYLLKDSKNALNYILASIKPYKFVSYKGGACGFHVHISKNAVINKQKLLDFFIKHLGAFKVLSGRKDYRYCRADLSDIMDNFNNEYSVLASSSLRYSAINFLNKHTIEFRIWRGTLNQEKLNMFLELSNNLGLWSDYLDKMDMLDFLFCCNNPLAIQLLHLNNDPVYKWAIKQTKKPSLTSWKRIIKKYGAFSLAGAFNSLNNNN